MSTPAVMVVTSAVAIADPLLGALRPQLIRRPPVRRFPRRATIHVQFRGSGGFVLLARIATQGSRRWNHKIACHRRCLLFLRPPCLLIVRQDSSHTCSRILVQGKAGLLRRHFDSPGTINSHRNPSSKSRSATARSARLYSSRLVSPFPDTGRLVTLANRPSAARPAPVLRTPESPTLRMRVAISGSRAPWALRLPITRDLPLSVSSNDSAHSASQGIPTTPQCPRFSPPQKTQY
jgi:hypothetical protein